MYYYISVEICIIISQLRYVLLDMYYYISVEICLIISQLRYV